MKNLKISNRKALTLTELIVVVLIFAILVSIAVPVYRKTIIRTKVRDAQSALRAIYAAQKIYMLKLKNPSNPNPLPYGADLITDINSTLHLDLEEINWDYKSGDSVNRLGQADIKPANNIGFRIGDAPIPLCSGGGTSGEPCCYKGCTLY